MCFAKNGFYGVWLDMLGVSVAKLELICTFNVLDVIVMHTQCTIWQIHHANAIWHFMGILYVFIDKCIG